VEPCRQLLGLSGTRLAASSLGLRHGAARPWMEENPRFLKKTVRRGLWLMLVWTILRLQNGPAGRKVEPGRASI
jgi:hypothetical protein